MSVAEAQQFANAYTGFAPQPNDSHGFSMTVFEKNGQYVLAIRGSAVQSIRSEDKST
jgi:hypothetical protein